MGDQFGVTMWRESLLQAVQDLGARMAVLLTSVAVGVLIVGVGWGLAVVAAAVTRRGLRLIGVDTVTARIAGPRVLEQVGIRLVPSQILSRLAFWLVFLAFAWLSAETLGLTVVTATVDLVLGYVPNLVRATIVILLGLLALRFLGTLVVSVATAGGLPHAPRLGFLAQVLIAGLVVVVAAEQLGLSVGVLIAPITALVAAVGFAGALAFALGARPIITHILAGHFLQDALPRNVFLEVNGQRGVVERIGPTTTVFRGEETKWSVPNARLLEEIVGR